MRLVSVFAAVWLALLLSAAEPDNFVVCRDELPACNPEVLSPREAELVAAVISGRNFAACFGGKPTCDSAKLTTEQVATLARTREEKRLQSVLVSARNFSACVYGQPTCDQKALTPEQISTLRLLAQQAVERPPTGPVPPVQPQSTTATSGAPTTARQTIPAQTQPREVRSSDAEAAARARKERWKRFGNGLLEALGAVAQAYLEVESQKASNPPIIVSGGSTVVTQGGTVISTGGRTIESRIDGTFEGWTGETIFKLINGQIWQQASYAYKYRYAYQPKVIIYWSNGGYRMQVEGVDSSIAVRQLR